MREDKDKKQERDRDKKKEKNGKEKKESGKTLKICSPSINFS